MYQRTFRKEPKELIIPVSVCDLAGSSKSDVAALIDTGATRCFIPERLRKKLGLEVTGFTEVRQPGRKPADDLFDVVDCKVVVGNVGPIPVKAVVYKVKRFFLGMDWYNQVISHYSPHGSRWLLQIEEPVKPDTGL